MSEIVKLPIPHSSILHPDVLYAPGGWNGFPYWLACTPYPEVVEDPWVLCSKDGLSWQLPVGLDGPIDRHVRGTYNSDPDLVLCDGKLFCIWRMAVPGKLETIFLSESSDGAHWTEKFKLLGAGFRRTLSPAVTCHDNLFYMYTVDVDVLNPRVMLRTARSIFGKWATLGPIDMTIQGATPWHIDVAHDDLGWYCLLSAKHDVALELHYGTSEDGLNWTMCQEPIVSRGDAAGVYRGSGVHVDGKLELWYSTYDVSKVINTLRHVSLTV